MSEVKPVELSPDQEAAARRIISTVGNDHLDLFYLGGPPGCGKSFLVNYIIGKIGRHRCAVMSPTAIAAQLIGGSTIHSFFGFNYHRLFDDKGNLLFNFERVDKTMLGRDLVICDEVSMVSSGYFQIMLNILQEHKVTILFVGDFMQLPPVGDRNKSAAFSQPAYTAPFWKDLTPLMLKTNFRQSEDPEFIQALADLRVGHNSPAVRKLIADRTTDFAPDFATKVFSKVVDVERENARRLAETGYPVYSITANVMQSMVGEDIALKMIEKARIPAVINLGIGARVVLLTNDQKGRWYNGSTGEVSEVTQHPGSKVITVKINLDSGYPIVVTNSEEHKISDPNGRPVVLYRQLPLMLAFAMTVHRIQGQTLQYVAVDLNNHFERGMTYVAISRCKTRSGLFLTGKLSELKYDAEAAKMYNDLPSADCLDEPTIDSQPTVPDVEEKIWGPTFQMGPDDEEF